MQDVDPSAKAERRFRRTAPFRPFPWLYVWLAILVVGWAIGFSTLSPDGAYEGGTWNQIGAMALVLCAISMPSSLPVLLYLSFVASERDRARRGVLADIKRNQWDS